MLQVLDTDILSLQTGILTHQVNTQGKMGRGLALAIARKWPIVYEQYKKATMTPGMIQLVRVQNTPPLLVCNLAGQKYYGRDDRCYTIYDAVKEAFIKLNVWSKSHGMQVYVPWHMGCGNGGGDWNTYKRIIEEQCPTAFICKTCVG